MQQESQQSDDRHQVRRGTHRNRRRRERPPRHPHVHPESAPATASGEPDALEVLGDAFDALVEPPGALTLEGRLIPGLPDRTMRLDEIRDIVGRRRRASTTTGDAVWSQVLLRVHAGDAAWRVAAAGLALPWLAGLARDVATRYRADFADVAAESLSGFLVALDQADPAGRRIAGRLRDAAHHAAIGATTSIVGPAGLGHDMAARAARYEVDHVARFGSAPPPLPYQHPDLVLIRAVADQILSATDADLIGATRIDKIPIEAWAAHHRVSVWQARQRRRRAEQALVVYLCDPDYHPALVEATRLTGRRPGRRPWCLCSAAAAASGHPSGRPHPRVHHPEEGSSCA